MALAPPFVGGSVAPILRATLYTTILKKIVTARDSRTWINWINRSRHSLSEAMASGCFQDGTTGRNLVKRTGSVAQK